MKSLMLLWKKVAEESATRCCTSATRDCKTVSGRCEHEGISFLTITLPQFGKDFEKSLDRGAVARDLFIGFRWQAGLPSFLRGFLERVFDRTSGVLLDDPCIDAILAVRQLTLMFSKIELKASDRRRARAMSGYIKCEEDVRETDESISAESLAEFRRVSSMLYARVFTEADRKVYYLEDIWPKHGPGATADKLRGNSKFRQRTWPRRLEEILPSGEFLLPNWRFYSELDAVDILEPRDEKPVRVISVPKTLKTPRIIGIEPTAMQYAQQGLLLNLLESLESMDKESKHNPYPFASKVIGFTDQEPNQLMALEGSQRGNLATLDLSEASDRVSNQLVREMFRQWPHLHKAIDACRSRKADVPGHGVIRLAKFASMGSALTFPIEAMVFLTVVVMGMEKALNTSLDRRTLSGMVDQVRIYGDDIIVPVDTVRGVVSELENFGFRVNRSKSFWTGKFRESCGREYYDGHDVSIVKVRQVFPTRRHHATGIISIVSLRNQLYYAGYWQTVKWLDGEIRKVIKYFPTVLPTSPVLGRHSFLGFETQKIGDALHNPLVKGYVESSVPPKDPLDGSGALLKFLLKRGGQPSVDSRHLERAGRPAAVNIKLRMGSSV